MSRPDAYRIRSFSMICGYKRCVSKGHLKVWRRDGGVESDWSSKTIPYKLYGIVLQLQCECFHLTRVPNSASISYRLVRWRAISASRLTKLLICFLVQITRVRLNRALSEALRLATELSGFQLRRKAEFGSLT